MARQAKVQTLAVVVELLRMVLHKHGLTGSTFHAVRTFQIISLALRFMPEQQPCTAEAWVQEAVARMAALSRDEWAQLVGANGVVAAQWYEPLAAVTAEMQQTLRQHGGVTEASLAQLMQPIQPATSLLRVELLVRSSDPVLAWQLDLFLSGRLSSLLRQLMEAGWAVQPYLAHSPAAFAFTGFFFFFGGGIGKS